jgi:hypothetical protein
MLQGQRDGHGIYQYADGGRYEGGWEGMLGTIISVFGASHANPGCTTNFIHFLLDGKLANTVGLELAFGLTVESITASGKRGLVSCFDLYCLSYCRIII